MSILRQLQQLRSRYRNAGIYVAAGMYEVFSTAPTNLHIWKQVPSLEEAVQLAKQLVQQHDNSVLNVWHHDEGQLYQVANRGGQIEELISAPATLQPAPEKERPTIPTIRGDWPEQMSDRGQQQRYSSPNAQEGNYWVRLGDAGEYEEFAVLSEVTDHLQDRGAGPVLGWVQYGVETEDFQGNNYISLYVGDENADPIRQLDPEEKGTVESALVGSRPVHGVIKEQRQVTPSQKILVDGKVYRPITTAEPVDDVGFDGFIGVFDPDKAKKREDALNPEWVLEKLRETHETVPEVVDEDVVKVHG